MKYLLAAKLLLLILISCPAASLAQGLSQSRIDELINAYTKAYKFNGTILVSRGDKVVFAKGYGFRNAKDSLLNTANTIYQLGSITKQFTAVVVLKLAEQKKLALSDKLSKFFTGYPKGDSITIQHLLTHSSGIYNYTENQQFMRSEAVKPATAEKMMAMFRDMPLNFTPGTKYAYSNSGYLLLGYIIEKVTGKKYEAVVREMIIAPLKMDKTGFDFTNLRSPDKATGYTMMNELVKFPATIVDSSVSFSAGALYSTVGDLKKWHRAMQDFRIISKTSTALAYTPYKSGYGFGWTIDTVYKKRVVEHGGGIFGFNTFISRVPEDDVVVVILNNMNIGGLEQIARSLLAIVYDQPYELPKERKEVAVAESILHEYAGNYELIPGFIMKVSVMNGKLKVQPTGQPAYDLFAQSENVFFMKVVEAQATFVRGADGKVEKMLWVQNGKEQTGKRIQ